jgi:hypothetical protein
VSDKFARWATGLAVLAVATIAAIVSYQHIEDVSLSLHQTLLAARLMPFGMDGLITIGSVVLLQGGRLGWLGIGPGLAISLFANWESAIRYGVLAAIWAAVPALSFFIASFILERWLSSMRPKAGTPQAATDMETVADTESEPVPVPVPVPEVEEAEDVQHDTPQEVPETETVADASRRLGMTLAETVAEFASEIKAGELPSRRQIMARAHTGAPRAKQIEAHLAACIAARPKPVGALTAGRVRAIVRESASV